jgi:hypothetical protein
VKPDDRQRIRDASLLPPLAKVLWVLVVGFVVLLFGVLVYSCTQQADYECIAEYEPDGEC